MTYRVMTVCHGNICRSPMAAVLLREAFRDAGLSDVVVDSTGISNEEFGNPIDRRAKKVLRSQGHSTDEGHRARRISDADLANQDLILAMTADQARALRSWAKPSDQDKIKMYRSFDPSAPLGPESALNVADPWYGGHREFEQCLTQLEQAVPSIVSYVQEQS